MLFNQRTITGPVRFSGVGLHSGKDVNLTIKPAPANHGIRFVRTDVLEHPGISAHFSRVIDTSLATVIGNDGVIVSTIEHLMACLAGLCIDNAIVELDAYEVPVMDGSAEPFTKEIVKAGIEKLQHPRQYFVLKKPISLKENGKTVTAVPSSSFKITCKIDFDHPLIKKQTYSIDMSGGCFENEICGARTFGFFHEYELMKRFGLARGGSLDNAIVVDKENILNTEGLRYPDEFVRHKLLDCLGDFSLLGMPLLADVTVEKSGHAFNHAFLKKFLSRKDAWETRFYETPLAIAG